MASTFVALTETMVSGFDVNDLFDRLVHACVDVLGAAAAGLMLADSHGTLQLVASTSPQMRELELSEMRHGQGPCLDAFATGEPVTMRLDDPRATARWPQFLERAGALSLIAVQALPMRLRSMRIGALNVFYAVDSAPTADDARIAQAFADVATIAILQRRALASSELLTEQLQAALNDRIVIEQAKGLLAERGQLNVDAAFRLLRDFCRAERLPLTVTAREIVLGTRDPDEVLAQRWPSTP